MTTVRSFTVVPALKEPLTDLEIIAGNMFWTWNSEFIELFNSGVTLVSLDGYSIDLINGSDATAYRTIDLAGHSINAGGYFVVCSNTTLVMNCDYSFTTTNGWFQNGAPDGIGLYENSVLQDALSYEGSIPSFTEGSVLTVVDSNTVIASIARIPDGFDSDDNAADFRLGCITPGTANIEGTGDCSAAAISAVPVPAAAWLFAGGLAGLVGFGRRK